MMRVSIWCFTIVSTLLIFNIDGFNPVYGNTIATNIESLEHPPGDSGIPEIISMPTDASINQQKRIIQQTVNKESIEYPEVKNKAFQAGEYLKFSIRYLLIFAGTAELKVEEGEHYLGRDTFKIVSIARSTILFFYKVRDEIVSLIDRKGLFSWRFEKKQQEGFYENQDIVNFYHEQKTAERFDKSNERHIFSISPFIKDILGAFYYIRTQPLNIGDTYIIPINDGRKNYDLEVRVVREENIKAPAGKFNCLLLEPMLKGSSLFENKGKVFIWVTNDEHRMPVLMSSKIIIGSIYVVLTDYRFQ